MATSAPAIAVRQPTADDAQIDTPLACSSIIVDSPQPIHAPDRKARRRTSDQPRAPSLSARHISPDTPPIKDSAITSQLSPLVEATPSMAAPQPAIGPAGKQPDFQKARAHREYYLAQLAEAEFHKVQGSQVELEAVKTGAFNAGRLLRDQLLGMPPQLAPELAAMTDPWEIERRLTAAIRASLEDAERMSTADLVHALNHKS